MIDILSVGCVLSAMIQGTPCFMGESSMGPLIEVIKVLATNTKTQIIEMNPNYDLGVYKFPKVKRESGRK
jgi:hypothetical protein